MMRLFQSSPRLPLMKINFYFVRQLFKLKFLNFRQLAAVFFAGIITALAKHVAAFSVSLEQNYGVELPFLVGLFLSFVACGALFALIYQKEDFKSCVVKSCLFSFPLIGFLAVSLFGMIKGELGEDFSVFFAVVFVFAAMVFCVALIGLWRAILIKVFLRILATERRFCFFNTGQKYLRIFRVIRLSAFWLWMVLGEFGLFIFLPWLGFLLLPFPILPARNFVEHENFVAKTSPISQKNRPLVLLIASRYTLADRKNLNQMLPEKIGEFLADALLKEILGSGSKSFLSEVQDASSILLVFPESFFVLESDDLTVVSRIIKERIVTKLKITNLVVLLGTQSDSGNRLFVFYRNIITGQDRGGFVYDKSLLVPFFEDSYFGIEIRSFSRGFFINLLANMGYQQRSSVSSDVPSTVYLEGHRRRDNGSKVNIGVQDALTYEIFSDFFQRQKSSAVFFICYESLSFSRWMLRSFSRTSPVAGGALNGNESYPAQNIFLVLANQSHFFDSPLVSGSYELLIRQLTTLFRSVTVVVSNFGTSGVLFPAGELGWFRRSHVTAEPFLPFQYRVLSICDPSCAQR